jgi:hypothetical protein
MPQLCIQCGEPLICGKCPGSTLVGGTTLACQLKMGAIWVHVLNEEGKSIPNVRVTRDDKTADTDIYGVAVFDPLPAKTGYKVALGDLGLLADEYYLPERHEETVEVQNGNITYVPFELKRWTWIGVRVWNSEGKVLSGVTVSLQATGKPAAVKTVAKGDLGADGEYKLEKIAAGKYEVSLVDIDSERWDVPKSTLPTGKPVIADYEKPALAAPASHPVVAGDCLWTLAVKYGLPEEAIWKDGGNTDLAKKYKNGYTLMPGTTVAIPAPRPKTMPRDTGLIHDFVIQDPPREKVVRFVDRGKPAAEGIDVKVKFTGVGELDLKTGKDGEIRFPVPLAATEAQIEVPDLGLELYKLQLGKLRPVESPEGVLERMKMLGYYADPQRGKDSMETAQKKKSELERAVTAVQKTNGIPVVKVNDDGTVDDATQAALVKLCGA